MSKVKNAGDIWVPTKEVASKILSIQIENSINEVQVNLNNKSFYEHALINKSAECVVKIAPELKGTIILDDYIRKLPLDKTEFIYNSVYSKTGGVLNLFNPEIKEDMDEILKNLIKDKCDKNKAIEQWKKVKSEFWSGLTPELVWAGGGKVENLLLVDFNKQLTLIMENRQFYTKGSAIIAAIEVLRAWQVTPREEFDNKTPMEIIIEERKEIYNKKIELIKSMNIESDF
ncbi:hypothetical protein CLOACE_17910 [Clostridium acetireducens DSM 10703]|jgi:hypothetical protein|uniref:Uncharacterized protein n=1 Tax=Clostridium acetireducens DSM 10703 TaxID=1121290 RepID=A0A1E8EX48_9CLOT|nr:hypothetical protein [Clostridium acetireducens]OFI05343.1 hypothetical protein CLOACE_17910 [Clostridium acetireducens DSM 10703]